VFMHMLTRADQEAYLARVVEHLAPGGRCWSVSVAPSAPRWRRTARLSSTFAG
jgi:hypothetical protein